MTVKEQAIESIKNATKAIGLLFSAKEEFEAVKIKDSEQNVQIEGEYSKGTKVSVSSSTGSIPAPDGKYELTNGQCFATKGGVISEITMSTEEAEVIEETTAATEKTNHDEASPEAELNEETPAEENKIVAEIAEKVEALENAFAAIKEAFATKEDFRKLGENFATIQKAFEVLSDTPAEFSKVDNSVVAKEEKQKRLEALASIMKK